MKPTVKPQFHQRSSIYYPQKRPGFVAWVTGFDYQNSSIGISFKETKLTKNTSYIPPKLEMGEAVGAPVSYASVECGSEEQQSYRVYMKSDDNGKTFIETGRCQLEQGSFCNVGFGDGRIIGFDVPRINEKGTGWCDYIEVRESFDGGSSWTKINRILEGCAPYLWRVRRLLDGTIILCASLYGTPWGDGQERTTRNTMLPGESYLNKIQTFFMTSVDGKSFSEPHYILPGTGAHEFDFVELKDGSLLFIAGDVQATPCARQIVKRTKDGYINGTLYQIKRGAPQDPKADPQGGFVPETMVMTKDGLIVGSRRNKPYSCSNDFGENWFEIEGLQNSLYQPFMMLMPNQTIANFGHFGGDASFGQADMFVGCDFFTVQNSLPKSGKLSLSRMLSENRDYFTNVFSAKFFSGDIPVSGEELLFRFTPVWNENGSASMAPQDKAPVQIVVKTDENGIAVADARLYFDGIGDIHFSYNVDVVYRPSADKNLLPCDGPMMCVAALTPYRGCRYPYDAYFAEGVLFFSPAFIEDFPDVIDILKGESKLETEFLTDNILPPAALKRLLDCGVLHNADYKAHNTVSENKNSPVLCDTAKQNVKYYWHRSVHSPKPLFDVLPMAEGDRYE